MDKEVVKTGFGSKVRATIRHLKKKNKKHKTDKMALTSTVHRCDGDSGVRHRSSAVRKMLHARKSMRPTVIEFEDYPVLGDLKNTLL